jgi:hypothetical protein
MITLIQVNDRTFITWFFFKTLFTLNALSTVFT